MSGRTVIGPDPLIPITDIVIPEDMAKKLTVPITVSAMNISIIENLVENDKINYVLRSTQEGGEKTRYNMKYASYTQGTRINFGDNIYRNGQMIDGQEIDKLIPGDRLYRNGIEIKDLKFSIKKKFNLQIGDIVEKQLENGQYVVANRQPTQRTRVKMQGGNSQTLIGLDQNTQCDKRCNLIL
jgi:DNA-directed RNA polymerase beta' subunit